MPKHELLHRRGVPTFVRDPIVVYLVRPLPIHHHSLVYLERGVGEAHNRLQQIPKAVLDMLLPACAIFEIPDADDV